MRLALLLLLPLLAGVLCAQAPVTSAERTKMRETREVLRSLALDLEAWAGTHEGQYPEQLNALVEARLREELPKDSWGRAIVYERDEADGFKLTSHGADGKPGGDGAAADIVWTDTGEVLQLTTEQKQELEARRDAARHEARIALARRRMLVAGLEALKHRRDAGKWPAGMQDIRRAGDSDQDKAINACLTDPWGNAFELRVLPHENVAVICWGEGGEKGGTGRSADFVVAEREIRGHVRQLGERHGWRGGMYDWQAQQLASEVVRYRGAVGKVPDELADLTRPLPEGKGDAIRQWGGIPNDRWGNEYVYLRMSDQDFAIVGLGQDGKAGGVGDDQDVLFPPPGQVAMDEWGGDSSTPVVMRRPAKDDAEDQEALAEVAAEQMRAIAEQLNAHKAETGEFPDDLEAIREKLPGGEVPKDPWDAAFLYEAKKDGTFELICLGSDSSEGGTGHAADITFNAQGRVQADPDQPKEEHEQPDPEEAPQPAPEEADDAAPAAPARKFR